MLVGEILGIIAGALVTISTIPQLVRVFKLRSAHEISLPFTIMLMVGFTFWTAYGFALGRILLIIWNMVAVALISVLLFAKIKYGR